MLILDATPGGVAANTYCTRSEADAFFEGHFYASAWTALIPGQKDVLLVQATRLLDEQVQWHGIKSVSTQALRWPRLGVPDTDAGFYALDGYGGYTISSTVIPQWLKNATAEMARELAIADRSVEPDMLEFTQMSVGTLSLTKDSSKQKDVIPPSVAAMVSPYGVVRRSSGMGVAKLVRA